MLVFLKQKSVKKDDSKLTWILYALLAIAIILYAVTSNALIGAIALLTIIIILVFEVRSSVKAEGTKKSIYRHSDRDRGRCRRVAHTGLSTADVGSRRRGIELQHAACAPQGRPRRAPRHNKHEELPLRHTGPCDKRHERRVPGDGEQESTGRVPCVLRILQRQQDRDILPAKQQQQLRGWTLRHAVPLGEAVIWGSPARATCATSTPQLQGTNLIRYNYSVGRLSMGGNTYNELYTSSISC